MAKVFPALKRVETDLSPHYLIVWMQILGINPLIRRKPSKSIKHKLALIFRYVIWSLNMLGNTTQLVFYFSKKNYGTATQFWSDLIDYVNWSANAMGVHSVVLFFGLLKNEWIHLFESLMDSQKCVVVGVQNKFNILKHRKCIAVGLVTIFLTVCV